MGIINLLSRTTYVYRWEANSAYHVVYISKAITNVPIHTNGSAQMQYCAVVDEGNFVRLGRFNGTCTSAKIHLEAQEVILMSKLGVISSVKYGCEISVSKFVNCESFHRVCSIRNIVLVTSMYKFTESHPSHPHKQHDSVNAAFKISKHLRRLCKYFLSGRWCWWNTVSLLLVLVLLIDWQDSAARAFAFELPSEDLLQSWKSCESMHLVLHVNWTAGHTDRSTRRTRHNHSTKPSIPPTRIDRRTRERRKAKRATPSLFVKCSMGYAI